ncbi:MAG: sugar ABC transporter permease [Acidobacteria bacterium]|nr:MAG: sugar ABC transporter permease [Acidobacteriota bacterium]
MQPSPTINPAAVETNDRAGAKRRRSRSTWSSYVAIIPAALVAAIYVGTMAWTIWISFTSSKMLPVNNFVGFDQYQRLFQDQRWQISATNLVIYCVLFIGISLVLGLLLAIALDQRVRAESAFRTIFLYPQGMSFIVTGLVWQWIMNPELGLQKVVHQLGWTNARLDWIADSRYAIYVLILAGVWQATGLVMAIMLAGLRGVDAELWKAARVDGIPMWRFYAHIVVPLLKPMFATAIVLLAVAGVKLYDLVVAMTGGGPGISTEVPAKFVMEYLFRRANIGLATAAASVMFVTVLAVVVPWIYVEHFRRQEGRKPA